MHKKYEHSDAIPQKIEKESNNEKVLNLQGISFERAGVYTKKIVEEAPYTTSLPPEYKGYSLCEAIANFEGESTENILLGNGSSDLLYTLLLTISPKNILFIGPLPEEYLRICTNLSIPYTLYSLQSKNEFAFTVEDAENISKIQCEMTIICSPNNLTGTVLSTQLLFYSISSPWVLLDLSCREFLYNTDMYQDFLWKSLRPIVRQGVHLITLHDFSHFFCAEGLALSYIVAKKKHISFFAQRKSPYTISPFTTYVGKKMLKEISCYREELPHLVQYTYTLLSRLSEYPLFSEIYFSKEIGFITASVSKQYSSIEIYEYLLSKNIAIHYLQPNCGFTHTMLRIKATQNMERLYNALDKFLL